MSSGFVSSGQLESNDSPTESRAQNADTNSHDPSHELTGVDAWAAADAAVKVAKEKAAASGLIGSQEGGKSLYEVLQANKAHKQEAFEEKLKFKNQFRSLDEGEVEFLDTIISEQRAEEEAKKKEIEAQLDDFRKLQYEADHDPNSLETAVTDETENTWAVSARRKRKKDKDKEQLSIGVKLRKMSDGSRKESTVVVESTTVGASPSTTTTTTTKAEAFQSSNKLSPITSKKLEQLPPARKSTENDQSTVPATQKQNTGLGGLVAYGSDSEDD